MLKSRVDQQPRRHQKILRQHHPRRHQEFRRNKQTPNNTPAAPPPAAPSTDPEICAMETTQKGSGLPSFECTLKELPKDILTQWNNYMTKNNKDSSDIVEGNL
uniref:Putative isac anti-complement n=1 Tax=Ixodes ricinus TaxID=34613 RepID=A0A0K8RDS3_IXORI